MKKLLLVACFCFASIIINVSSGYAAIITNGSFEDAPRGAGWTYSGQARFSGYLASDGILSLDFGWDNKSGTGRAYQWFDTTIGQEYQLKFDYASHGSTTSGPQKLRVHIFDGTSALIDSYIYSGTPYAWDTFTYNFTATTTSTRLWFGDYTSSGASYQQDGHVDNVSVVPLVLAYDNDDDGIIDIWDDCSNTTFDSAVYSNGCRADDLYACEDELTTANADNTQLQSDLNVAVADLAAANAANAQLQSDLNVAVADLAAANAANAQLQSDLDAANAANIKLQSDLDAALTDLDSANETIEQKEELIEEKEEDIDSLSISILSGDPTEEDAELIEETAQKAIDEARDEGGKEKEIDKAEKEMIKAEKEFNKEKYDKAVDHYGKAWEHTEKAMEEPKDKGKDKG